MKPQSQGDTVKVKITRSVLVAGETKRAGEVVEVTQQDARTLVAVNKAQFATEADETAVYGSSEAGVTGERVNAKTNMIERVDYKGDVKETKPNRPQTSPHNRVVATGLPAAGQAAAFPAEAAKKDDKATIAAESGESIVGEEKVKKTTK